MNLIVDTYNALHAWATGPAEARGRDVAALAALIARGRYAEARVRLVCDGIPPGGTQAPHRQTVAGAEVLYAGAGVEADALIEELVGRTSVPNRTVVVSSDRRVQKAARRRGAAAVASEDFIGEVIADARDRAEADARAADAPSRPGDAGPALSASEVGEWMQRFGFPDPPPEPPADAPQETPRDAPAPDTGAPAGPPAAAPGADGPPAPSPEPGGRDAPEPKDEAWIDEALGEWGDRLDPDDLDMERWLGSGGSA